MPLSAAALEESLTTLMTTHAATPAAAGLAWANAFGAYAASVVPASATVSAAQTALSAALGAAFGTPSAPAAMDTAFAAAGVTIAGGMAPAFSAVAPLAPIGWAMLLAKPYPATAAAAAAKVSAAIHAWMLTGSATLVASPFTEVPEWS